MGMLALQEQESWCLWFSTTWLLVSAPKMSCQVTHPSPKKTFTLLSHTLPYLEGQTL